ncbi:MAG: hypothetical protein Q7T89_04880 [Anaerolineales bacterium]|nr:hypothetical protein [Anaerolineales bacterium]
MSLTFFSFLIHRDVHQLGILTVQGKQKFQPFQFGFEGFGTLTAVK